MRTRSSHNLSCRWCVRTAVPSAPRIALAACSEGIRICDQKNQNNKPICPCKSPQNLSLIFYIRPITTLVSSRFAPLPIEMVGFQEVIDDAFSRRLAAVLDFDTPLLAFHTTPVRTR